MREININIEGYNVNGICVGCLNYNRKMFYCEKVKDCFKILGNIDVPDGLSIQVCWECLATVQAISRFRSQIISAYEILINYSREHTFLNAPSDLSQFAVQRLSLSLPEPEEPAIKFEVDITVVKSEAKDESDSVKSETEMFDQAELPQAPEVSSEDDMQLSKLKRKKEKRIKKSKKKKKEEMEFPEEPVIDTKPDVAPQPNHRKLRNLPLDLVELYTMTEEEMWQIRAEDVDSKEFCSMKYRCHDCIIGFSSEKIMLGHMMGKHVPKSPSCHQCDVCRAFFLTRDNVALHRARHLAAFRCRPCGAATALKRRALAHARQHRGPRLPCHTCGEEFSNKSKLSYHKGVCNQARPHCDCCGKVFANKMTLKYHLKKVRPRHRSRSRSRSVTPRSRSGSRVFRGTQARRMLILANAASCNNDPQLEPEPKLGQPKLPSRPAFYGFNVTETPGGSMCFEDTVPLVQIPGGSIKKRFELDQSIQILPQQNKESKPKEKLHIKCKGCEKVFHSKKSYRAHVVIHDGLSYPCPVCGKLFQWKRNLARHTRNHRERDAGATHECKECGKTFSSRDCYNNHMKLSKRHVHEDAYVHECSYCGKKFATKWCMVDHVDWDHLKRVKYQCSVCFKAFKTAKIMVAHMNNIHEGKKSREPEGEHLCEICGKSYKTVKRLKGHVWAMHTNRSSTKSYKCRLCPATFTWQTSIYKHMKMMHDNKRPKLRALAPKKPAPFAEGYYPPDLPLLLHAPAHHAG